MWMALAAPWRFMQSCPVLRQRLSGLVVLVQCKEQKSNRLSYIQFRDALKHIAKLLDSDLEQVKAKIISSQVPRPLPAPSSVNQTVL